MRSEYLQRYHACQLPEEEMSAVLRVLHLAHGARRHPDVPRLPPEEAQRPVMDHAQVDRFVALGVITIEQASEIKATKRGDTVRQPSDNAQGTLFAF